MIINHNLQAINANRQIAVNASSNAKSMEKLSSGLRINRAGDDAAGLSISEKMRAQINGLNQASRNAQDGISMIQTAEGALDETHSILQRMRELSVQATTDTNDDQDRDAIQKEMDALTEEIDRISETTEFNGKSLLDGDEKITLQVGANADQHIDVTLKGMGTSDLIGGSGSGGHAYYAKLSSTNISTTIDQNFIKDIETTLGVSLDRDDDGSITKDAAIMINGLGSIMIGGTKQDVTVRTSAEIRKDPTLTKEELALFLYGTNGKSLTDAGVEALIKSTGEVQSSKIKDMLSALVKGASAVTDGGNTNPFGNTVVNVVVGSGGSGIAVGSASEANSSISTLDEAIKKVSEFRSELGAIQNRLEHTIKNLDNAAENTQAAESRIRDVDMAEEMMEFTKTNVLQQASQSMLAQANQKPNQVLQLLG